MRWWPRWRAAIRRCCRFRRDERARVARVAERFSEEDLTRFMQIMLRTHSDLGYKQEQRFHLELGLLKLVHAQRLLPLEELLSGEAGKTRCAGIAVATGRRRSALRCVLLRRRDRAESRRHDEAASGTAVVASARSFAVCAAISVRGRSQPQERTQGRSAAETSPSSMGPPRYRGRAPGRA